MASLRDIRRRIASVQSTRKITKAMEMVAAAKLRRNQMRIEALRPYALSMVAMMQDLGMYAGERNAFPLLREHDEVRTIALVAFTGDRGLAGAFNANVIRRAVEIDNRQRAAGRDTHWMAVGRKGVGTLAFRGYDLRETYSGLTDRPEYGDAQRIAARLIDLYASERVDEVHLVYNRFRSPLEYNVEHVVRLPIKPDDVTGQARPRRRGTYTYTFEPNRAAILEGLLPAYVEIAVYRALLESSASEQGARMTSMRNASESAEEMLDSLTMALNRARQAAITQEILEVVAGAEALR